MRLILLTFFLSVIILTAPLRAAAQFCKGSLGDAVINEDFGTGASAPLPAGETTMQYVSGSCPADGQYSIASSLTGSGNCHQDTWHSLTTDHTGNGNMMIVNANNVASVFFTEPANNLCPNTTYQFSAYILNLIKKSASGSGVSEPDITFSITTSDGTPIAQPYNTGTIQPSDDAAPWQQYSMFFTTPANVSSVIVVMTNNAPGGNGNDLVLDDINFRACGPTVVATFNSPNSSDPVICAGDNITYNFSATIEPGVYTQPAYQWQFSSDGINWTDIPGETTTTYKKVFTNAVVGTYVYRLGVADGANITSLNCRVYSVQTAIVVNPLPVITSGNGPDFQCEGDDVELFASSTDGVNYVWSGPNLPATNQNPVFIKNVTMADAGTYTVTVSDQANCSSTATTQLTVSPKVTAVASGGTTICSGDQTQLTAAGGSTYLWSPGKSLSDSTSANPSAFPTDTTTYKVIVTSVNGCKDSATVTVNVQKKAIADAGPNKVIFEGQSVQLSATAKYSNVFSWTPTTGLSDPAILNPVASPTDDITYTLQASSVNNCGTASSSVFVKVYKKITIPDTFSPNGDGINDFWNIEALITYPQSLLLVFNRYGQQVYRSVGYAKPWNGKYDGQPVPPGTYYYVLDLKNNTPKISGWVLIVR